MKTQKKKTFNLNKLQIAKFEYIDAIKGGTKTRTMNADCGGDTGQCIESFGC
ncbi:hypothetical protein [uncultured Kordia sp.]|uniref:hypothetical protein n=1 Tax=uncultured Kordia sp. TaxID=507699 RepID=UPI00262A19A6|nr:hypothetical protein [uncultured Kordia sp.]